MSMGLLIPVIVLILAFILRVPIAIGMIISGIIYLFYTGGNVGLIVDLVGSNLYSNYVVIAVPLFVFTANVMNSGTVTDRIFSFANTLVGRFRGGLGHVNILASLIFSGMTGSALADAAGLGKMEIRAMRKNGYDGPFSCAVTAASATIGPIFPPSIPMILYAMLSGASVGALFLGGVIPAFLLVIALMAYVFVIAKIRKYPYGMKYAFRDFLLLTLKALPALFTPVVILIGIYTGVMTATEAGAVAALYGIVIAVIAYRALGVKGFIKTVVNTVKTTGNLGLLLGAAFVFSYIVQNEGLSDMVADWMLGITNSPIVFLLIINAVFIILGMFLDTSVITFVFIPIVLPLLGDLNIDLVHFGVLITLNMMIGLSTPPFGMLLFIVSGISGEKLGAVIKEITPMVLVMLVVLLLITFVPQLVLFIPGT